jgi:hypothetical protein
MGKTAWVKPGEGASLETLLMVAKKYGLDRAELKIYRLIDKHGKSLRTNLMICSGTGDMAGYDLARIEGMLVKKDGELL